LLQDPVVQVTGSRYTHLEYKLQPKMCSIFYIKHEKGNIKIHTAFFSNLSFPVIITSYLHNPLDNSITVVLTTATNFI